MSFGLRAAEGVTQESWRLQVEGRSSTERLNRIVERNHSDATRAIHSFECQTPIVKFDSYPRTALHR